MPRALGIGLASALALALLGPVGMLNAGPAAASSRIPIGVAVYDVAFTPDGLHAYAVGFDVNNDGRLFRITLSTNTTEQLLGGLERPMSVAVTPDGSRVIIGGYDRLYVVNPSSPSSTDVYQPGSWIDIQAIAVSNDAVYAVNAGNGALARLAKSGGVWPSAASWNVIWNGGSGTARGLAVTADDSILLIASEDGEIRRLDSARTCSANLAVSSRALSSNVATLTTAIPHGYAVGRSVTVAGVDPAFDGTYTISAVPTDSTFSYSKTATDVASTASTGTANVGCSPTAVPGTNESGSHGIAIHPSGTFAYYARNNQSSFRRLDLNSGAVTSITGDSGPGSRDVAFSQNGAFAYFIYRGQHARDPKIEKVRTSDNTVVAAVGIPLLPCNSSPWGVAASPSATNNSDAVLVAGLGHADASCATLTGGVYRFPTTAAAPTSLSASPGNGSATISFTAGSDGFSDITNYQYSTDNGATYTALSPDDTTSPITIPALVNGTTYQVRLRGVNASGNGAESSPVSVTPRTVPDAPTAVSGTGGNASVSLSWTAPASTGGSAVTGYLIERSTDGTAWTTAVANTGSSGVTHTVTGLVNGTAYTFRVSAINAAGTGAASTVSAAVTPRTVPGAPTAVTVTAGDAQASISWTEPVSNGGSPITSYTATAAPGGTTCTTAGTSCTVTGLVNGTAYTFTVTATNAIGTGSPSMASTAVTPTAPPTPGPGPGPGPIPDPMPTPTPTPTLTPTPTPTPSPTPTPTPTPSPTPTPTPTPSPTEKSLDGVVIPAPDGYGGLPPAPVSVSATRQVREGTRVEVVLPEGAAGTSVQGTVVTVRDREGRVAARVTVTTPAGEVRADVQVPFVGPGFTVTAYNINANGVSPGASITSPLVRASTLSSTPGQRYIGTRVGKPIAFAKGSARLDASDKAQLRATATRLKSTLTPVYVTGHAGSERGTPTALSLQRARAVAQYLSAQGVRVWIRFDGIGDKHAKGRPSDRRAEIRAA